MGDAQELDEPALGHLFVKKLVARALDKHNHEREMASLLLSALAGEVGALLDLPDSQRRSLVAGVYQAGSHLPVEVPVSCLM